MPYTSEQLSDMADITDLLHSYCRAVDDNRPDDIIMMFVEDCELDYGGALGQTRGRTDAYKFFRAGTDKIYKRCAHYVSNIEITFTGPDTAEGITYVNAWHEFNEDIENAWIYGRYLDDFVRTDEGWLIARRHVVTLGQEKWPNEVDYLERNVLAPRR